MWNKKTLTTASPSMSVAFNGRGSVFAEGTFGSGTLRVALVYKDPVTGERSTTTTYLGDAIDGSTVNSIDLPSGEYQLSLVGSTGASIDVYYNTQQESGD